jgi:hypothetical protein
MTITRNLKSRTRTLVYLASVFVIAFQGAAQGQSARPVFRSEFRYTILSNEVWDMTGKRDMGRSIQVLLDGNAFSEETLTKLFKLLIKRYPEPQWMDVSVVTSLYQVATPEEAEREVIASHTNNHPEYDLFNHAVLMMHDGDQVFRYTINIPRTELKTVVLKGCDPPTSKCASDQ